ncbi:hypothetical protein [Palleronia abyssalis]|uniref:Uncharacterized protein n=1 Tax=Palleronia abyssalis TaxID=1501240 RepID=A0A2R8BWS2_9RHOB|nr:hypothetical protein [Palleronia abyssalis]SPJ24595.1 hypothetical protein PAA8504_02431 [Palleronia abyssalis]
MNFRLAALAIAASSAMAAPIAAQDYDFASMQQGLTMLELNVSRILRDNGFDTDVSKLSLSQIVQIIFIAENTDEDRNVRNRILAAIEM